MPEPEAKDAGDIPHYHGHRDRLRQRFITGGADALADYELLELLLFMAIPRRDVKPLAKELLKHFGTLSGVLHAPLSALTQVNGISENTAIALIAVGSAGQRMLKQDIMNTPVLNSGARLMDYCRATLAHEPREHFRLLFLNKKNELIADEIQQSGTIDHTPAYPREVMKRALELGATAIILCHNHPSGDARPSKDDILMTEAIIAAGKPLNIVIHDHIIVSKNGTTSFRNAGLI